MEVLSSIIEEAVALALSGVAPLAANLKVCARH